MAPMRQEYDNERVSNERLNAPSPTRDKYENLALTRNDDGLLVLRFHTAGSPAVFTGQTDEDFPAALEEISLRPFRGWRSKVPLRRPRLPRPGA